MYGWKKWVCDLEMHVWKEWHCDQSMYAGKRAMQVKELVIMRDKCVDKKLNMGGCNEIIKRLSREQHFYDWTCYIYFIFLILFYKCCFIRTNKEFKKNQQHETVVNVNGLWVKPLKYFDMKMTDILRKFQRLWDHF